MFKVKNEPGNKRKICNNLFSLTAINVMYDPDVIRKKTKHSFHKLISYTKNNGQKAAKYSAILATR